MSLPLMSTRLLRSVAVLGRSEGTGWFKLVGGPVFRDIYQHVEAWREVKPCQAYRGGGLYR